MKSPGKLRRQVLWHVSVLPLAHILDRGHFCRFKRELCLKILIKLLLIKAKVFQQFIEVERDLLVDSLLKLVVQHHVVIIVLFFYRSDAQLIVDLLQLGHAVEAPALVEDDEDRVLGEGSLL